MNTNERQNPVKLWIPPTFGLASWVFTFFCLLRRALSWICFSFNFLSAISLSSSSIISFAVEELSMGDHQLEKKDMITNSLLKHPFYEFPPSITPHLHSLLLIYRKEVKFCEFNCLDDIYRRISRKISIKISSQKPKPKAHKSQTCQTECFIKFINATLMGDN